MDDLKDIPKMDRIENEKCPMCQKNTLTLYETEQDIPHFGKVHLFGMLCSNTECNYKQNDVESDKEGEPTKLEFTIQNSKDLNVRVVKSSEATVKIPALKMEVEPGVASDGYVSNIEGVLQKFKHILEVERDAADEDSVRTKAKNLLKRLWKVECGDEELKVIIEDPSGNSAIISEKTVITPLKPSKKK
jgi:zinc finger protein